MSVLRTNGPLVEMLICKISLTNRISKQHTIFHALDLKGMVKPVLKMTKVGLKGNHLPRTLVINLAGNTR